MTIAPQLQCFIAPKGEAPDERAFCWVAERLQRRIAGGLCSDVVIVLDGHELARVRITDDARSQRVQVHDGRGVCLVRWRHDTRRVSS